MRKRFPKLFVVIAWVLSLTFCFQTVTYAGGLDGKYISEVIIVTKDYVEKAEKAGYYVYQTKPIYESENTTTYLAVKTTDNADEAITDIRTMNMSGGWSFEEYQKALEQQKDNISALVKNTKTAVEEFRENYKAGKAGAIQAKKALDLLYDDDLMTNDDPNTALLGDLLLKDDFDFANLEVMLLEGCSDAYKYIFEALSLAVRDTNGATFFEVMGDEEEFDPTIYEGTAQYNDDISKIIESLDGLQEYVKFYESSGYTEADGKTDEQVTTYFNELEPYQYDRWLAGERLTKALKDCKYHGYEEENGPYHDDIYDMDCQYESLYDLFMKYDLTVPDAENGYEYRDFNPFVACLSPGQRAILEIGVDQVVMSALATDDTIESAVNLSAYTPDLSDDPETDEALAGTELEAYINEVDDKMTENLANVIISMVEKEDSGGAISVFNGVNRVVFHSDNVALTSKSLREKNAEELMNFAKVENDSVQDKKDKLMYAMIGLGAGAVVTGGAYLFKAMTMFRSVPLPKLETSLSRVVEDGVKTIRINTGKIRVDKLVDKFWKVYTKENKLSTYISKGANVDKLRALDIEAFLDGYSRNTTACHSILSELKKNGYKISEKEFTFASSTSNKAVKAFSTVAGKIIGIAGMVCLAALLVVGVIFSVLELTKKKEVYHTSYIKIPSFMCSEEYEINDYGKVSDKPTYLFYEGVKNPWLDKTTVKGSKLKDGETDTNDQSNYYETDVELPENPDKIMDIYNWSLEGLNREWVCLYTSKDKRVGKPILADSINVPHDTTIKEGNQVVSNFGVTGGTNLMQYANYCNNTDEFRQITFEWDGKFISSYAAGSIFAEGKTYLIGGVGLLLGFAIGFGVFKVSSKPKTKAEGEEED